MQYPAMKKEMLLFDECRSTPSPTSRSMDFPEMTSNDHLFLALLLDGQDPRSFPLRYDKVPSICRDCAR